jgi:hypothetical protein
LAPADVVRSLGTEIAAHLSDYFNGPDVAAEIGATALAASRVAGEPANCNLECTIRGGFIARGSRLAIRGGGLR